MDSQDTKIIARPTIDVGEWVTNDGRTAQVDDVVLGADNCSYYIGSIDEWPKPVIWDEYGKDIYGGAHLIVKPVAEKRSPSTYWIVRNKDTCFVEKACLSEEAALQWVEGMELFYDIVRFEEAK